MVRPLLLFLAMALSPGAMAAVSQCVDSGGHVLLTDSACPDGYQSKIVVPEQVAPTPAPGAQASDDAARWRAEAGRAAAQAEAARLRQQLDDVRMQNDAERDRLRALDDKIDSLLERQDYGLTFLGPPIWAAPGTLPPCADGVGRPWADCRPRPAHADGRHDAKGAAKRDRRFSTPDTCGMFGCTPGITRAPWDDDRRGRRPR